MRRDLHYILNREDKWERKSKQSWTYHFLTASAAVMASPPPVVQPMAKLSPWPGLSTSGEWKRSCLPARICANPLAACDIVKFFWMGGEKCTERSSLWASTMASINRLSEKRDRNEIFVSNMGQKIKREKLTKLTFSSVRALSYCARKHWKMSAKLLVVKSDLKSDHKKKWDIFIKMFDFAIVYYWLRLCIIQCKKCCVKFICNWLVVNCMIVSCY